MKRLFLILVGIPLIILTVLAATEQLAISETALEISAVDWPSDGSQLRPQQATIPPVDLSISKVGSPEPAAVDKPLTYSLTVVNHGYQLATGITLVDFLPVNVEFGTVDTALPSSCSRTSFIVICYLKDLASSGTATVTIVVTPTQAGTIFNTAAVVSTAPEDTDLSNNTAIEQTVVTTKIFLPIIFKNYP